MAPSRYSKRQRYKYKNIAFKLSYKQKDQLDRCAKMQNITPLKLIKQSIKEHLDRYQGMLEQDNFVAENQLSLFEGHDIGNQLSIFDEIDKMEE